MVSTEYCVKCADCDVLCNEEWGYFSKISWMIEYVKLWEHIKPIVESDHFTGISDENQKFFDMSAFMLKHATHTLLLHDEYGRDFPLEDRSCP